MDEASRSKEKVVSRLTGNEEKISSFEDTARTEMNQEINAENDNTNMILVDGDYLLEESEQVQCHGNPRPYSIPQQPASLTASHQVKQIQMRKGQQQDEHLPEEPPYFIPLVKDEPGSGSVRVHYYEPNNSFLYESTTFVRSVHTETDNKSTTNVTTTSDDENTDSNHINQNNRDDRIRNHSTFHNIDTINIKSNSSKNLSRDGIKPLVESPGDTDRKEETQNESMQKCITGSYSKRCSSTNRYQGSLDSVVNGDDGNSSTSPVSEGSNGSFTLIPRTYPYTRYWDDDEHSTDSPHDFMKPDDPRESCSPTYGSEDVITRPVSNTNVPCFDEENGCMVNHVSIKVHRNFSKNTSLKSIGMIPSNQSNKQWYRRTNTTVDMEGSSRSALFHDSGLTTLQLDREEYCEEPTTKIVGTSKLVTGTKDRNRTATTKKTTEVPSITPRFKQKKCCPFTHLNHCTKDGNRYPSHTTDDETKEEDDDEIDCIICYRWCCPCCRVPSNEFSSLVLYPLLIMSVLLGLVSVLITTIVILLNQL